MAQQGALPRIFEEGRQNDALFICADRQINTRWRNVSGATRYVGLAPVCSPVLLGVLTTP